jgi:plasmid stability protein
VKTADAMMHLEAANPIDATALEDWSETDRAREILRRAVSTPPDDASSIARHHRVPRLALSAVATVIAVAIAVVVAPVSGTHRGSNAAAAVLQRAARVAERQPATPMPVHGYRYTKSRGAYLSTIGDKLNVTALVSEVREFWVAADGSGRLREKAAAPRFFSAADKAAWEAAGRPPLGGPGRSDRSFGPRGLTVVDLSRYSTNPDELYDQIRKQAEGHGSSTDAEMLVGVEDLLHESVAPPEFRAALFRVAARIPGVELIGKVTDPAGRRGVAVARTSNDSGYLKRDEMIFNPHTSQLLAEREVLLERVDWISAPPGTVIGYSVYLKSGIVRSTTTRP